MLRWDGMEYVYGRFGGGGGDSTWKMVELDEMGKRDEI